MRSKVVRFGLAAIVSILAFLVLIHGYKRERENEEIISGIADGKNIKATEAMEAMRWYNNQRAFTAGEIPIDWRERALSHTALFNMPKSFADSTISWESVGPNNIGGRVRSIAIDPINPNIIYCGSVSGGLWKSTDSGGSWASLTDFAPNLVIGCIAIDPTNTQVVYAGTGEGYFNIDALRGIGVLKSTDGGSSWSALNNFPGSISSYAYYFINKILIRPDNPNTIFVATSSTTEGIWKSTNAGASWSRITAPGTLSKFCVDLEMDPSSPDIMYAAFGLFASDGIYKTTNGGTSWSKLTNGFPSTSTRYGRISLAIAPSNNTVLYAVLTDSNYYTHSIMKSTDAGASWFAVTTPYDNTTAVAGTHLGGQGWYNNEIVVHPTEPNIVYVGGINLFKSSDGGSTWNRLSDGYGSPYVHVDQHAIAFYPTNPSIMYFGNDGGIFKSTDGGSSFVNINSGFTTVQFYSGAVHPTSNIFFGGTQDNGTLKSGTIPQWSQTFGGDGGATWIDYQTPTTVYTEYVQLCIQKSTNSGAVGTWVKSMNGIPTTSGQGSGTTDRCSFIAPFVMDPTNPLILVAGTYKVYRTVNGAGSWTAISGDITGSGAGTSGSTITALAIAKSSSSVIYAGTSGSSTDSSRVVVSISALGNWVNIAKIPLPNRYVTSIAIDPVNADSVYVAFSGYSASTPSTPGHVFLTPDRGTTWTNVSGDLPDIPVNAIIIDRTYVRHLLIGTDIGVFETVNGGSNWTQRNTGMANVAIADLDMNDSGYVFAATHGRGMFKTITPLTAHQDTQHVVPRYFALLPNHPNPFNVGTLLPFTLSSPEYVTIKIYNILGQEVATQIQIRLFSEGTHSIAFDGTSLPSGVYFYRIIVQSTGDKKNIFTDTRKMLLVR